jgi:hypothetical protein
MRLLLMMGSLLIISSLIFNQYSNGMGDGDDFSNQLTAPIEKAENVSQLVEDTANLQRQALEKQIQQ